MGILNRITTIVLYLLNACTNHIHNAVTTNRGRSVRPVADRSLPDFGQDARSIIIIITQFIIIITSRIRRIERSICQCGVLCSSVCVPLAIPNTTRK